MPWGALGAHVKAGWDGQQGGVTAIAVERTVDSWRNPRRLSMGFAPENQVRTGLPAGARGIRLVVPQGVASSRREVYRDGFDRYRPVGGTSGSNRACSSGESSTNLKANSPVLAGEAVMAHRSRWWLSLLPNATATMSLVRKRGKPPSLGDLGPSAATAFLHRRARLRGRWPAA